MEPIEDTLRLLDAVLFGPAFPRHAGVATVRTGSASLARFLERAKYYGSVQVVEADTGIEIREPLRSAAGLTGEVAIFGPLNCLEVWDHARFLEPLNNDPFTETDARVRAEYGI